MRPDSGIHPAARRDPVLFRRARGCNPRRDRNGPSEYLFFSRLFRYLKISLWEMSRMKGKSGFRSVLPGAPGTERGKAKAPRAPGPFRLSPRPGPGRKPTAFRAASADRIVARIIPRGRGAHPRRTNQPPLATGNAEAPQIDQIAPRPRVHHHFHKPQAERNLFHGGDRITVLRRGSVAATLQASDTDAEGVAGLMVGGTGGEDREGAARGL